ncbi:Hypothetical_protein [Hexamita inflata]|uniref:Hypothetical_protein n=1 Tax=Hexamita inflata TaxID=28002 RepID=A0AA86NT33_9EUKA|nr:Hypothetical protein HINF_LOCUS12354 [Hexamita inflata]CAI9951552.1 Hypothetical protein HINF_LOCUS39197 [Hexamita inflata]
MQNSQVRQALLRQIQDRQIRYKQLLTDQQQQRSPFVDTILVEVLNEQQKEILLLKGEHPQRVINNRSVNEKVILIRGRRLIQVDSFELSNVILGNYQKFLDEQTQLYHDNGLERNLKIAKLIQQVDLNDALINNIRNKPVIKKEIIKHRTPSVLSRIK